MSNRRLASMPPAGKPRAGKGPAAAATFIAPSGLKTWHAFAFLILVAILIHYKFHYLILLVAAFAGFCNLWLWLAVRFPRTMTVINIIMLGLLRGGRRR